MQRKVEEDLPWRPESSVTRARRRSPVFGADVRRTWRKRRAWVFMAPKLVGEVRTRPCSDVPRPNDPGTCWRCSHPGAGPPASRPSSGFREVHTELHALSARALRALLASWRCNLHPARANFEAVRVWDQSRLFLKGTSANTKGSGSGS